jgi:PAS domain S-box-containing protein
MVRSTLPQPKAARPLMLRYAMAFLMVVAGWLARTALTPAFGPAALPFITFFPAVAGATWFGGMGPGLFAIGLSAVAADWFFFEPVYSFRISNFQAFLGFPVAAGFILAAIELMHRARRDLVRTRDTLLTTLRSIGDGVIVTDSLGQVTFLNDEAERLTGWKTGEAHGKPLADVFRIVNEETNKQADNPVEKVLRDGKVVGLANHTILIARDGSTTPIDDSAAPVTSPGQPIEGVVLVFRDVRQQRVADAARARLAAIVESSGDAIVSKSTDGVVQTWNAAAEKLFGFSADEMVGRSITTIIPPDHLDEERTILDRLRSGRGSELIETIRLTKDGRRIPVSVRVSPIHDSEGKVIGASKTARDLSSLVAIRDALMREKELLATTLASIGDAVIITDVAAKVTFLNPIAESLTRWTRDDAAGRPLTEVFRIVNETSRAEVENPALRAMREGAIVGLANHTVLLGRDGIECAIDDSAAPIRDSEGKVVGSVLVFRDVTVRRRAERALREADQRKNEFLATLAHELRNPLAPIKNSIALLQLKGPQEKDLVDARRIIDRQVEQMSRLLDDLLDASRLDRKKLRIRKEPVTLSTVLTSALEIARPEIESRHHHITLQVPDDIVIDADPMRLSQVFANLLNNAAKYTDEGGQISVNADRDGDAVNVSVRDNGMGIVPEALPRLFEMFTQVPGSPERTQGGAGIGLSLAQGLVELHGGTIAAESKGLGKGSVFTVRIPLLVNAPVPDAPAESRPPRIESPARRILIADDVRDNADTLAALLRAHGHVVQVAYDGAQAVALGEHFHPDVGLFDIAMPIMSGFAACREIRSRPWGETIFMIAQTGWGQEDDRQRARDAGFDHHLLKPIDSTALLMLLAKLPQRTNH